MFNTGNTQVKQTENINQIWLGYFNQTRFSNKWGLWADLHLRTKEDFFTNFSQSIVRLGLTYYLNDATKLTAGYAYVSIYPGDNHKDVAQPEHRSWHRYSGIINIQRSEPCNGFVWKKDFGEKF